MEAEEGKYREKYKVYAGRYGGSERTIKRWVATGDKAADPCPLDDPDLMRDWWARNMSQRCPDKLLAAAVADRISPVGPPVGRALPAAPELELPVQKPKKELSEPLPLVPRELRTVSDAEMGTEASLARLKQAEVHTHEIYLEALTAGKDGPAKLALKSFTDLAEQVAKLEGIVEARRIKNRDLIPRLEAETLLGDFHQELLTMLRGLGELVFRVYGIPATAENDAKWQGLIIDEGVCEQLQREVFAG